MLVGWEGKICLKGEYQFIEDKISREEA